MAETIIKNTSDFNALYGDKPILFSTNEVSTTIISGITAVKAADQEYWVNGDLTYTIVITNTSGVTLSNISLIDPLDDQVDLVEDSVTIDDTEVPYSFYSNILTVALPEMADTDSLTVKFKVLQV